MNISNWSMGKILMLPDHVFGRRWPISIARSSSGGTANYEVSRMSLPERMVVWEFWIHSLGAVDDAISLAVSLGDHLPANDTEFFAFDPLFKGVFSHISIFSHWFFSAVSVPRLPNMKVPIAPSGRRLVIRVTHSGAALRAVTMGVVISDIPQSIPECYNF